MSDADAGEADLPADLRENPYVLDPPTEFPPVDDLDPGRAREQAARLREAIRYHDHRYYVAADPVVADRTYDRLFDRLRSLEETFELDAADSPTRRVGGRPVEEFDTVAHVAPMLSVDPADDPEAVRAFDRRVREAVGDQRYVCEPKFDGVSIEAVYEDGRLQRAVTRGDGREGDDVTANVRTIPTVPARLRGDPLDRLAVRGEIYMPRDEFAAYNRERVEDGQEPFANPRNATAGTLRQQDPSVVAERPLACFFFDVLSSSDPWESRWAEHRAFPELGLRVADRVERVDSIEAAIDYRDRLLADREDLAYEVDGVVVKVDDRAAREKLGATSRHYRWAVAYKFPARSGETRLVEVAVQVGRTGRLTPVALLDPVDVGGVTVSRASLHNPAQVDELGVAPGDRVRVERAGDVIPQVVEVLEDGGGDYEFPEACPVCSSPVRRDGPNAFCTGGWGCPRQFQRALEHYASRSGLDVEGLGPERIDQLIAAGLLADGPADLYELTVEDLRELEGFGERSAEKLLAAVDASREPPLADFLAALGVPEVGSTTARALAREFGDLASLREADRDRLQAVEDVGPAVADAVAGFFEAEANRAVVDALLEHVDPQSVDADVGEALDGQTFVFTGSLDGLTRSEATDLVERAGGRVTASVSGATDYLVVGENPGTTKREDAAEEDVPELAPGEFRDLLAEAGVDGAGGEDDGEAGEGSDDDTGDGDAGDAGEDAPQTASLDDFGA
jgi:DNA ligase (NAD+)